MCVPPPEVPDFEAAPGFIPGSPPLPCFETAMQGLRQYHAITTALDLNLFALLERPMTGSACAETLGNRGESVTLLCDCLVAMGLLDKEGNSYRTGAIARQYLLSDSPHSQQNSLRFQRQMAGLWSRLPDILREGPVTYDRAQIFRDAIIPSMAETCRCGTLQQVASAVADIPEFHSARRLLDLGGGHGLYSIALCTKNPSLTAVVFDLSPVTEATKDFIGRYRADRVTVMPGDFFTDPLGNGYDIVFSSSNPGGKVPSLIPKIAAALNDGGLYINKQALDDSQQDPFLDLEWNLWAFSGMQKQPARYRFSDSVSFADYNRMLEEHGFVVRDVIPVDGQSAMTVAQKAAGGNELHAP